MADGDVLTIVTGHQAFAPAAGGVQTISLLGPFRVNWNTVVGAGVFGDQGLYFDVTDLADGCLLLSAWAETVTRFNAPGSVATIFFALGTPGDTGGSSSSDLGMKSDVFSIPDTDPTRYSQSYLADSTAGFRSIGRAISGAVLQAYFGGSGDAPSGAADIYAFIATPT